MNPCRTVSPVTSDIRLVILDIDGTICGESNEVNLAVVEALRVVKDRGVRIAIATGRMYCSALYFAKTIGADLPIICYNGAWIRDAETEITLRHLPVPSELARELLDYCEHPDRRGDLDIHFYLDDQLYVREVTMHTRLYIERSRIQATAVGDLRSILDKPPTKVLAMSDKPEVISILLSSLQRKYSRDNLYLTQSNPYLFEACHPGAGKGKAVRYLVEEVLKLKAQQTLAIGDNLNDLEMLEYAAIGVAMGDAPAEVKAQADWVAPGVEEDGVVQALDRFILTG